MQIILMVMHNAKRVQVFRHSMKIIEDLHISNVKA